MRTGLQVDGLAVVDPRADTVRIRVLPEPALQQRPGTEAPVRSFDPYSSDISAPTARPKPRRTLDDMRRLSEAIVRSRLGSK